MKKKFFTRQSCIGALFIASILTCGDVNAISFDPSICKTPDPDGNMYLSLGTTVFRLPATEIDYFRDPLPGTPQPAPPDPSQPVGCREHPLAQQNLVYSFNLNFIYEPPDLLKPSKYPLLNKMQIYSAEADFFGVTYEDVYTDFCQHFSRRITLKNGLHGCLMDRSPDMRKNEEFGAYQANQNQYTAPFNFPFTVYCNAAIPFNVGVECTVAYKLYRNVNITYSFFTAELSLEDIIIFDQQLRKDINATIVSHYPWKNSEDK